MKGIRHLNRFLAITLIGLTLMLVTVFFGHRFVSNVLSQEVEQTTKETEKQMEKEEKLLVEFLRSDQARRTHPEKVLKTIDELGKIARLRGISSTDTMNVLAEYLEVHKDSLIPSSNKTLKQQGIIFQPHPIMPEELYPAVVTFKYIGKPAKPILLRVIENNEIGSVKSKNAIFLIKHCYREDWNKAADYLKEGAESAKSEEGRKRLLNAAVEIMRSRR